MASFPRQPGYAGIRKVRTIWTIMKQEIDSGISWTICKSFAPRSSDILTSTLAAFLFSSHPKRERNVETHLNYYASTHNRGRQLSQLMTKLNLIQQNRITTPTPHHLIFYTTDALPNGIKALKANHQNYTRRKRSG